MNNLFSIILLFVVTSLVAQEKTVGVLQFEEETIDYGLVAQNSDGERTFTFTNTGDAPVVIERVKGSCGCTVATKPTQPILPGETAEIGVHYDTKRIGGFSKTITITSNASEAKKVVRIKGNVMTDEQIASTIK